MISDKMAINIKNLIVVLIVFYIFKDLQSSFSLVSWFSFSIFTLEVQQILF